MDVKVKKAIGSGVHRFEGKGDIKEIMVNADFFMPEKEKIDVCFKGENSSGIIQLSLEESRNLVKELKRVNRIRRKIKVLKLKK